MCNVYLIICQGKTVGFTKLYFILLLVSVIDYVTRLHVWPVYLSIHLFRIYSMFNVLDVHKVF